jgi:hypothetical protein
MEQASHISDNFRCHFSFCLDNANYMVGNAITHKLRGQHILDASIESGDDPLLGIVHVVSSSLLTTGFKNQR